MRERVTEEDAWYGGAGETKRRNIVRRGDGGRRGDWGERGVGREVGDGEKGDWESKRWCW